MDLINSINLAKFPKPIKTTSDEKQEEIGNAIDPENGAHIDTESILEEFHLVDPENPDVSNPLHFRDVRVCLSKNYLNLHDDFSLSLTCHYQRQLFIKEQLKKEMVSGQLKIHKELSAVWQFPGGSLKNRYIRYLVFQEKLDIVEAERLVHPQIDYLQLLKKYIDINAVAPREVLAWGSAKSKRVELLLSIDAYKGVTYQQLCNILNYSQVNFDQLLDTNCIDMFTNKKGLTSDQFFRFPTAIRNLLKSAFICKLFCAGHLNLTEVDGLQQNQLSVLKASPVQRLINKRVISAREAIGSPDAARLLAEDKAVRDELVGGRLSKAQVLAFTPIQLKALTNEAVQTDLGRSDLEMEDVLAWSADQVSVLNFPWVARSLKWGHVTAKEVVEKAKLLKDIDAKGLIRYDSDFGYYASGYQFGITPFDVIKSNPKATRFLLLDHYDWGSKAAGKGVSKLFRVKDFLNLSDEKVALFYEPSVQCALEQSLLTFEEIRAAEDVYLPLKKALLAYGDNSPPPEQCRIQ